MRVRLGLRLGGPIARSGAATLLGAPTWGPNGLLEWRDALVEAGWDGAPIPGGGDRLAALAAVEGHHAIELPPGHADRLVRIERALAALPARSRVYDSIVLDEDAALWSRRWQAIFHLLSAHGTSVARRNVELPGARAATDLALIQARLRGEKTALSVRGDGTVLFLRGDTPGDLAELTASLLAQCQSSGGMDVLVRCRDAESLDPALVRHGLAAQGCSSDSVWRPAMQVLPLAIELAFEPRDPFRVLELLTLPVGPFRGGFGARLARAVTRQPGVGGQEWNRQKDEALRRQHERRVRFEREQGRSEEDAERLAAESVEDRRRLVATWLEAQGADPHGARRADLVAVCERVRGWLQRELRKGEVDVYGAAYAQTTGFAEALANDTREVLSQEDARQLLDRFARLDHGHALWNETAGRLAHVSHPAGILAACDRVTVWSFVADIERKPLRLPWNEVERSALEAAGVSLPDPSALLRADAEHWRRAVLSARQRVVFVVPRAIKGTATAPHPLWDEICARLALGDEALARITRDVRGILDAPRRTRLVPISPCAPLGLPEARPVWHLPAGAMHAPAGNRPPSVTALEKIATCPLAWVLEHRADVRSGAMSSVVSGSSLNGRLSHRLAEELHAEGAFELGEVAFLARAEAIFEVLLQTEGATLLLPGASIERLQLTRQVRAAMRDIYRYLRRSGFRIAGVEEVVSLDSALGPLQGRLDLRLEDVEGRPAILDLKWGASTYRQRIERGRAVQLAAYSRALASRDGRAPPPAAYFALAAGQVLSTDERMNPTRPIDGPSLETTWRRVEATAKAVIERHASGEIHVSGARRSLPLLDALGVSDAVRDQHFDAPKGAACEYCDYDALCGRRWEALL